LADPPELGQGWRLAQYPGNERWWLHHQDRVHGYIYRDTNMSGNKTSWQAVKAAEFAVLGE
jgi:hypothetical protein